MEIKRNYIKIDEENPFKNDWLNRESFADNLISIIKSNKDSFVLGLSGQWGDGKTTFLRMWQQKLKLEGLPCIYFDAFEHDYMDSVFLSIAIEILNFAKKNKIEFNDYADQSKSLFAHLQTIQMNTPPISFDNSISGEHKSTQQISESIEENLTSLFNNTFDQAVNQKQVFNRFKESLGNLATNTSAEEFPLIIIVDELDRCKPSYAIEVLEKIKHLFSVKNVVFVLSMHQEQLQESVKKVYGENIDSHTYLQKFIDYSVRLPKAEFTTSSNRSKYFWNRVEFLGFPKNSTALQKPFTLFLTLADYFNLSYRQLNKALQNFRIYVDGMDLNFGEKDIELFLTGFISILVVVDNKTIHDIRTNEATFEKIIDEFRNLFTQKQEKYLIQLLKQYLSFCFRDFESLYDAEYGSQELNFSRVFGNQITNGNVLLTLVNQLECFEN